MFCSSFCTFTVVDILLENIIYLKSATIPKKLRCRRHLLKPKEHFVLLWLQ